MSAVNSRRGRPRRGAVAVALSGILAFGLAEAPYAAADEDDPYPSASASVPVEVDAADPDLKLAEGATLAEPKVLDIKSVVEDLDGEERREDTNEDIKLALQSEVLFGKDSAVLSSEAKSRIAEVAAEVKEHGATKVRIFGFTDNLGSSAHGDVLSRKRANAVHKVLAKDLDSSVTYEVRGYGEQYPIADNSTEEGRKKNRRVEISFPRGGE
ncbi:OmpA family protein [Streptomyces fenghuangensis]|uniref:OmpA family protein n=1 Tax=Streptomyces sp. ICN903 TaxID=2964654 RepID=UPI001EDB0964|nr:OmpA family protein [Streptomyces sp. ICN903]MCG3041526.1 OmpA family protein [Streptomyces sp. ICN903]